MSVESITNQATTAPSARLERVRYEIRGALARRARELEAAGHAVLKLNIGNPGRFGFRAPAHLTAAMTAHLADSDAYCHEQGVEAARAAILAQQCGRGAAVADIDRVFIGNGVSELIDLALRALLDPGDEVLLPSPDYPLWSAATILNDGTPRYYDCPAAQGHLPGPDQIEALCGPHTRALVLINPNNPTGACYPRELLERIVEIAARHGLLLLCDEIYDGILYDDAGFTPLAALAGDLPCVSFGGLSKVHRACGFRVGWMTLSGAGERVEEYRDALQLLAALRLCANVPAQWAIEPALTGPDTISALTAPGGRLYEARRAVQDAVARSQFLECVVPQGALYAFPAVRAGVLSDFDDNEFALRVLDEEHALVVPGSSFNLHASRHFRITLLPEPAQIADVFARIERVLERMVEAVDAIVPDRCAVRV
jgi:alanine-synthesizing transaminase